MEHHLKSTSLVLFLTLLCNGQVQEHPIVQTIYGNVRGIEETSRDGGIFYAFKGIPYAKAPVGNLRFKAPEEPLKWDHILDTQKDASYCIQKNYLFANPKVEGSEDCLYLNVYTPKLRSKRYTSEERLLPVMVFIHWGGFFAGYGTSNYLGPEYFMDENVVLVTFNYRLGVMGFLSTNDDAAPGNYGFKDQTAVLKWVQKNVEFFGGNKRKVTIFGQSAGGASVHYHLISQSSKNLFHQAISESGTALSLWAKPMGEQQLIVTKTQALFMGCNNTSTTQILVDCLRNSNAKDLVNSGDKFKFFSIDPLTVYLPSIETKTDKNPQPFITKDPVEYIRNNEFSQVPWIVGVVKDEGLIRAEPLLRQKQTQVALNKNFNKLMPNLLALAMSTNNIQSLWTKIKDSYFIGASKINMENPDSIQSLVNLYTDRSFTYSAYQSALFHNLKGHKNIWFYNFDYRGEYSYGDLFAATNETIKYNWGVSHCDELLYLFRSPAIFPDLKNQQDQKVSAIMIKLWTNFAYFGDPTPPGGSINNRKWLKLDNLWHFNLNKKINYFNIAGRFDDASAPKISMEYGFYKNRFKFWEDVPLVENIQELNETQFKIPSFL